ncbi:hypothetical protein LX77_00112 [Gelidibacter algens]|uniref:Uncharacterized protein n=1 Tax=Gelidibacter algens TaxID=49280 RepID=A0A1A7QZ81_9FLAO|nr:DUF6638 family protein [Gelidibacter algens]OBX24876.1 hypothetical protein A9996_12850 [Gelidibacter algens]RAJ27540.1 hypothetical protein LX77_00112 [Gelidibacter algens]
MNKLKEANLYRHELIPISGKLVERYNQCLKMLGFVETKLTSFSIDGLGWSPEIAEEKSEPHYLNNGEANPNAIIITPLQKGKPVYVPFHTFDRQMMQHVFHIHGSRINDITRDCAICVHFDQHIDAFYEPLDVLKYQDISITFKLINELDKVQKEQYQLIDSFKQGHNFIDEHLHQQLLDSAKTYGDLRHRNLELHELYYATDSFYTKAFGGVFVLRDFITPIIVFQDVKWHKEAIKDTSHDVLIYHISQPELSDKLRDHMIIEYDLEAVVKMPRYDRIKKFMFAQFLKDTQHPLKDILDDHVLFKGYLNKLSIEDRKKVMSVELYLDKMELSNQHKLADIVDMHLFEALQKPHSSLHVKHHDLIWKLLVNISTLDVLFLYWYDKEQFYKNYDAWDESLKDWVIATIRNNI